MKTKAVIRTIEKIDNIFVYLNSDKAMYNGLKLLSIVFFLIGFINHVFWAFSTASLASMIFIKNK